jgi:hypothetical protein
MATKSTTKKTTGTKTATKSKAKTSAKKTTSRAKKITENDIRKKAQEIYDKRILKGTPGSAESDWLQAEKALLK